MNWVHTARNGNPTNNLFFQGTFQGLLSHDLGILPKMASQK